MSEITKNNIIFKIGDSVRVNNGTLCPDVEDLNIGGWQGRVFEVIEDEDSNILICIEWDSITLKNMPGYYIEQCGREGFDHLTMNLEAEDIELTKSRDTEEDVSKTVEIIHKIYSWSWLGEEGKRIQKVLASVDEEGEMEVFRAWMNYLEKNLTFPFDAKVSGYQDKGPLQSGNKVSAKKISMIDDLFGIIIELKRGRKKFSHPLSDLEVINRHSPNYQPLNDYRTWFANR